MDPDPFGLAPQLQSSGMFSELLALTVTALQATHVHKDETHTWMTYISTHAPRYDEGFVHDVVVGKDAHTRMEGILHVTTLW